MRLWIRLYLFKMAASVHGRPPLQKFASNRQPLAAGRESPRNLPPSPRSFIIERQLSEGKRSSLTPVTGHVSPEEKQQQHSQDVACLAKSDKAMPMSHPLFAGWSDATMFDSLMASDLTRLQRRLEDLRAVKPPGVPMGRRDLLDPRKCVQSLAAMVLDRANVPALQERAGGSGSGTMSARRGSQPKPCDALKLLCRQLAERAARLEVMLGLIAELMVGQLLMQAADTKSVSLADATGCPSTRIGWIDEVVAALEAGRRSSGTPSIPSLPELGEVRSQEYAAARAEVLDIAVQVDCGRPIVACKSVAVQALVCTSLQTSASQTNSLTSCKCGRSLCASGEETYPLEEQTASQGCQTEVCKLDESSTTSDGPCSQITTTETGSQVEATLLHIAVQASSHMMNVCTQASALTSEIETQTNGVCMVSATSQTEAPAPPKPGGMREKRITAEEATHQLSSAREKLKLEKEAAVALQDRLSAAELTIRELHQETSALRKQAAASVAAAAAAMLRPAVLEVGTQLRPEVETIDVQTEPVAFYSHSWQARPNSRVSHASHRATVDVAAQTATAGLEERSTQTPREFRERERERGSLRDACVGDEEPLRLALGVAALVPDGNGGQWRDSYGQGMQVLAEQWRGKYEASEKERARLSEALAAIGAGSRS